MEAKAFERLRTLLLTSHYIVQSYLAWVLRNKFGTIERGGKTKCCPIGMGYGGLVIEVFVHSRSAYMDVELAREMSQHLFCDFDTATHASEIFASKFKGRILSEEDSRVLQRVSETMDLDEQQVAVYDLSRPTDRLKALSKGIRKTPAVIIEGRKCVGIQKCLAVLGERHQ